MKGYYITWLKRTLVGRLEARLFPIVEAGAKLNLRDGAGAEVANIS